MSKLTATVMDVTQSSYNGKKQFALKVKFTNEERNWDVERMVFLDASYRENETLMKGVEFKELSERPRRDNDRNSNGPRKDFK